MKRIIAILLSMIIIATSLLSLSGCTSGDNSSYFTVGQWLMLIDEAFGMQSYNADEPYFDNIDKNNPYFEAVQIATEWDVIDKSESLNVDEWLKWDEALTTLVNVGNFLSVDSSKKEKINYAIENFDPSIRKYWMNRNIRADKAVSLLSIAQKLWANKEFDHIIEKSKYKENVIDLSQGDSVINDYIIDGDVVAIPKNNDVNLKPGDIYVLPQNKDNHFVKANKVKDITTDDKYIYITNTDDELSMDDVAQDIFIEETFVPKAENAIIYDGNGQIISVGSNVSQQKFDYNSEVSVQPLVARDDYEIIPTYDAQSSKQKHTFTVGDWKINLEYKLNGALDFGVEVETPNMLTKKYQNEHPSQELTAAFAAKLNDFKVTNEVDYKLFKLNSASLRVDYEQELSGKLKFSGKPVNKLLAPDYRNDGNFANNWSKKVWKDADGDNAKGAKTIKICSVDLYTVGVARVCLDINFTISAEGSVAVTLTMRGAKGIEYKNGNMRLINTCDKDTDVDIKAKVEATLGVGPALYVVGLKSPIIGLQVSGGLGAAFNVKFNIADTENHLIEDTDATQFSLEFTDDIRNTEIQSDAEEIKKVAESQGCTYDIETSGKIKLHFDVCVDGSVYVIVRVSVTDTSYIAKLLGNKITTSWDVFGEKNGKILTIHNDNGKFQIGYPGHPVECSLKYVPFENSNDQTEDETTDQNDSNDTIIKGDSIILNQMYTDITVGKNHYIQLIQIPKDYKVEDIVCASSNDAIATVNKEGIVTAVSEGSAVITVSTKDKKYNACLAVTVIDPNKKEFEPLKDFKTVNYYFGNSEGVLI